MTSSFVAPRVANDEREERVPDSPGREFRSGPRRAGARTGLLLARQPYKPREPRSLNPLQQEPLDWLEPPPAARGSLS